jgi:hypothetical protein
VGVGRRLDAPTGLVVLSASPPLDSGDDGVRVLVLYGATEAPGGGPPEEALAGFVERFAELARREVLTVVVPGLGDGPGELDEGDLRERLAELLRELRARVAVVAFDVMARIGLSLGLEPEVVGVAVVEPMPVEEARGVGGIVAEHGAPAPIGELACPVAVVASAGVDLGDVSGTARRLEVHRLPAPAASFVLDPRVLAIVAGWAERAPWDTETP